jgi:hypothetical protein
MAGTPVMVWTLLATESLASDHLVSCQSRARTKDAAVIVDAMDAPLVNDSLLVGYSK